MEQCDQGSRHQAAVISGVRPRTQAMCSSRAFQLVTRSARDQHRLRESRRGLGPGQDQIAVQEPEKRRRLSARLTALNDRRCYPSHRNDR